MNIIGCSDKGVIRSNNQDAFLIGQFDDGTAWAVVCDGMGGANGGSVASRLAVDYFSASIKSGYRSNMSESSIKNLLNTAISSANVRVFDKSRENEELKGMGTTIVAAIVKNDVVFIAHAGDSRAYLLHDNVLEQLTRDHSIVQNMIEDGKISIEEARFHPRKNVITRALGVDEAVESEFTVTNISVGDKILLCTDGLSNYADNNELIELLNGSYEDVSKELVTLANNNGGGDNITAVVIEI